MACSSSAAAAAAAAAGGVSIYRRANFERFSLPAAVT